MLQGFVRNVFFLIYYFLISCFVINDLTTLNQNMIWSVCFHVHTGVTILYDMFLNTPLIVAWLTYCVVWFLHTFTKQSKVFTTLLILHFTVQTGYICCVYDLLNGLSSEGLMEFNLKGLK